VRNDNEKINNFVVPSKEDLDKMIKVTIARAVKGNQIEIPTQQKILSPESKSTEFAGVNEKNS
jgi:hypothetical protein